MMRKNYYIEVRGVITRAGTRLFEVRDGDKIGYIDAEEYTRRPNDAIAQLLSYDMFFFAGPKRLELNREIADIDDFVPEDIFERVGHNGSSFVFPDGTVFAPEGAKPGLVIFDRQHAKCHEAGDLAGWLQQVARPLTRHWVCEFFLMICFAGPLRRFTSKVENFGWNLSGPPACGKSVMLQLMASTCGGALNGDEGNYALTFSTTPAGLESQIRHYSDLPLIIDELSLFERSATPAARGRAFTELMFSLGKGRDKQRYRETSNSYRYVFATASNESSFDMVSGSSAEAIISAVQDRIQNIPLDGREFGIFDRLPEDCEDIGDFFKQIVGGAASHHGVAMRHFLEQLVNFVADDPKGFQERLGARIEEFRLATRVDANAGSARRVADNFGLVVAAGYLAQHLGALPDTFDPLEAGLTCYGLYKAGLQNNATALDVIRELAASADVYDLEDELPRLTDKEFREASFWHTHISGEREFLVHPDLVRQLIKTWNSTRRDDFEIARRIKRDKDDRHTVKRKVRRGHKEERVICFVFKPED